MNKLEKKKNAYNFFIQEAKKHNALHHPLDIATVFEETGRKRVAMVMPQSIGDCVLLTSLFKSVNEQYPDYDLYIATQEQYSSVFEGNPFVFKIIPYMPVMENELWWIGQGEHKGYVDIAFLPHIATQRQFNYHRNGLDKIAYEINY